MQKRPETKILTVPELGLELIFGRVPGGPWRVWDGCKPRPRMSQTPPPRSKAVVAFVRRVPYGRPVRRPAR
jgi:hypothetical protein